MKSLDHIPRYIRFATRVSSRPECQKELLRLAQQLFSHYLAATYFPAKYRRPWRS